MYKAQTHAWRAATFSLGIALLLALAGWLSLHHTAQAAVHQQEPFDAQAGIIVNTTNPGINDDGLCSLIEALENANADALIHDDCEAGSGPDTVIMPNDAVLIFTTTHNVIGGGNALPVITGTVTIQGNGATLVRNTGSTPIFRFFNVTASGNLTLVDLGLRNGVAGVAGTSQLLQGGGAIVSQGTLHLINSNLSYNHASFGGAIYSQPVTGSLTLQNTTFSYNSADSNGGAVYNYGPASITGGTLRFNEAGGSGGAIMNDSSTLVVANATVQDNMSADAGAGIATRALITHAQLTITGTSVISNAAALNGGGLYNTAANGMTSTVTIEGSHFIANRVISTGTLTNTVEGLGGGILNGWTEGIVGGTALVTVRNSSVTDNVAQRGGGIANIAETGFPTRTAQVTIDRSILAYNTAVGTGSESGTGGGLYNSNGNAIVVNSTLSANQAVGMDTPLGGRGGAIGNVGRGVTTTLSLLNSTIAFNEATQAGGGIAVVGQTTTTVTSMNAGNTLVVSNALSVTESITNAFALAQIAAQQVITGTESCSLENGTLNSQGGNIEDGNSCGFTAAGDRENTMVALGALADNGGPTDTHLITETGAAFGGGVAEVCAGPLVGSVDQRGVTRPQGEACDVGAVELEVVPDDTADIYFPMIYLRYRT